MVSVLCFVLAIGMTSAATFQGYLPAKPRELAHKEGCYIKEINDVIKYGEEVTPIGHCYRIECSKWRLYYASCGVVSTDDPKCFITKTDHNKPYPHCCPDVRCEIENNII